VLVTGQPASQSSICVPVAYFTPNLLILRVQHHIGMMDGCLVLCDLTRLSLCLGLVMPRLHSTKLLLSTEANIAKAVETSSQAGSYLEICTIYNYLACFCDNLQTASPTYFLFSHKQEWQQHMCKGHTFVIVPIFPFSAPEMI